MRKLRWVGLVVLVGSLFALSGCLFDPLPVADFDWRPDDPIARSPVDFTDKSTDSGGLWGIFGMGGIREYSWDFDDSDTSTTQNPEHEFQKSGDYAVELTVKDGGGNVATEKYRIKVRASLDGRWAGTFNDNGVPRRLELVISQTPTAITGTVFLDAFTFAINSIQLVGNQVSVAFSIGANNLVLRGMLDASETYMQGTYTVNSVVGFGWDGRLN